MDTVETLSAWSRALHDPSMRDLPYRIETNEYGQLVMSPLKARHGLYEARLVAVLAAQVDQPGEPSVEFALETSKGVKVPDVVWASADRWQQIPKDADASPVAPEICIEVLSEANTEAEIDEKRLLYFKRGVQEVWTCDLKGRMRFCDRTGDRAASALVPSFPSEIGD